MMVINPHKELQCENKHGQISPYTTPVTSTMQNQVQRVHPCQLPRDFRPSYQNMNIVQDDSTKTIPLPTSVSHLSTCEPMAEPQNLHPYPEKESFHARTRSLGNDRFMTSNLDKLQYVNPNDYLNDAQDRKNMIVQAIPLQSYGSINTSPIVPQKTIRRLPSILRMGGRNKDKTTPTLKMKKSASVEFKVEHQENAGTCRRLTEQEKIELYRVRPDLEIGLAPYYQEQLDALNRRNRCRILFAIFGGGGSVLILTLLYYLATQN